MERRRGRVAVLRKVLVCGQNGGRGHVCAERCVRIAGWQQALGAVQQVYHVENKGVQAIERHASGV